MTETPGTPENGINEALHDLSTQTQALVRRELDAALAEMGRKAKLSAPGVALLAASGGLALLAVASSYRFSLRLLEKMLPPAAAAFAATAGYGGAAAAAAVAGIRWLREAPLPVPAQTARETTEAARRAGDTAAGAAP